MALIKCEECGNQVSDKAKICPHCGIEIVKKKGIEVIFVSDEDLKKQPNPAAEGKNKLETFVLLIVIIFVLVIVFSMCSNSDNNVESKTKVKHKIEEIAMDPLGIGGEVIIALVGKRVPYEKWSEWGVPNTQQGTNNVYWIAYLKKANISFISNKKTDEIIYAAFGENSAKNYMELKAEARKKQLEKQFSAWDGSHNNFTILVKAAMHDPSSFEHVETRYFDKGETLIITMKYRGNNAFGGKVLNTIKAEVDMKGNIIQVYE